MSNNIEALKPGKYAILYRDNWDGEGDVYHTLANLEADGRWLSDETGKELLEYEGDEILKSWPLDDGFDTTGLIAALGQSQQHNAELTESLDERISTAKLYRLAVDAGEQRIAELEASKPLVSDFSLLRKALANAGIAAPETDEELSDRHVISIVKFVAELDATALCVKSTDAMREVTAPLCVKLPEDFHDDAELLLEIDFLDDESTDIKTAQWLKELRRRRAAGIKVEGAE